MWSATYPDLETDILMLKIAMGVIVIFTSASFAMNFVEYLCRCREGTTAAQPYYNCNATCMEGWEPAKYELEKINAYKDEDKLVYSRAMIRDWLEQIYQKEVTDLAAWRYERISRPRCGKQKIRMRRNPASRTIHTELYY